jgi:hypothetical protein
MLIYCILLITWSSIICARLNPEDYYFGACQQIVGSVQFNNTDLETGESCVGQICACNNQLAIASLYLCNRIYCSPKETSKGISDLDEVYRTFVNVTLPPYSIVEGYTEDEIDQLRHLQLGDVFEDAGRVLDEVVVPLEKCSSNWPGERWMLPSLRYGFTCNMGKL